MLKKIPVSELRQDMFVHELCGSWMDHPFWRSAFVLKDKKDIKRLRESAVSEVWIDTSKGCDVAADIVIEDKSEADSSEQDALIETAMAEPSENENIEMAREVRQAQRICEQGKETVVSMFNDARMGGVVDVAGAEPLVEEITASVMRNSSALISLARLRTADDYTYLHSVAVCAMMVSLGKRLGLGEEQIHSVGTAGLLHDLGKAGVPLEILNKPGKLTDDEFAQIKAHPGIGHHMLSDAGGADDIALDVCLHHHEKLSGKGYPDGLGAEDISLFAKMGAVCDVYDAVTSDRPYKPGWEPSNALMKMNSWCGDHFDPKIFQQFVKCVGIYPIGSLVRTESEKLGVVVEQRDNNLLQPILNLVYCTKSNTRLMPKTLDLAAPGCQDRIVNWEDPAKWQLSDLEELWANP